MLSDFSIRLIKFFCGGAYYSLCLPAKINTFEKFHWFKKFIWKINNGIALLNKVHFCVQLTFNLMSERHALLPSEILFFLTLNFAVLAFSVAEIKVLRTFEDIQTCFAGFLLWDQRTTDYYNIDMKMRRDGIELLVPIIWFGILAGPIIGPMLVVNVSKLYPGLCYNVYTQYGGDLAFGLVAMHVILFAVSNAGLLTFIMFIHGVIFTNWLEYFSKLSGIRLKTSFKKYRVIQILHACSWEIMHSILAFSLVVSTLLEVIFTYMFIRLLNRKGMEVPCLIACGFAIGLQVEGHMFASLASNITNMTEKYSKMYFKHGKYYSKRERYFLRSCLPIRYNVASTLVITKQSYLSAVTTFEVTQIVNLLVSF